MALDLPSLEKQHSFLYTKHLVFLDNDFEQSVKKTLLTKTVPKEALHYGTLYEREISLGYEAPSTIQFVHEEVGYGLYSIIDLPEGAFIGEYTGVICENAPYYKVKNYAFSYPLEDLSGRKLSIDAEPYGNLTRFINHSFEPNLIPVHAFHNGLYHIILIAKQPIKKGEQFTYSYGHSYWYLRGTPMSS
jgi:uncharacterized protein